jgi:succinyl-CoA synthetase beta subunit
MVVPKGQGGFVKLREHQAKAVFAQRGIRVPRGEVVTSPVQAEAVARRLGGSTVIKPQLGVKGRGKVGGIGFAETAERAAQQAQRLLGSEVRGERVQHLLVEQRIPIEQELYLAVVVDYAARQPVLMASSRGGVDIEEVARTEPEQILRIPCSVLYPPSTQDLLPVEQALGSAVAATLSTLYQIFIDCEAELVEVNPVAVTRDGLVALDAVLNVNDDGVARHPELQQLRQQIPQSDPLSEEARQQSWTYIDLGGEIAILSSGAGLTMTIVDLLARRGGSAANFLDTAQIDGPGIYRAFELLRRARPPRVWLVNIFAGLNRCDHLAQGIRNYLADHPIEQPVVVRMVGNMEQRGHQILQEVGIQPVRRLEEAIDRCVELAGGAA